MENPDIFVTKQALNEFIILKRQLQNQLRADIKRLHSSQLYTDINLNIHSAILKSRAPLFYTTVFGSKPYLLLNLPEIEDFIKDVYFGSDVKRKELQLVERLLAEECRHLRFNSDSRYLEDNSTALLSSCVSSKKFNNLYYSLVPTDDFCKNDTMNSNLHSTRSASTSSSSSINSEIINRLLEHDDDSKNKMNNDKRNRCNSNSIGGDDITYIDDSLITKIDDDCSRNIITNTRNVNDTVNIDDNSNNNDNNIDNIIVDSNDEIDSIVGDDILTKKRDSILDENFLNTKNDNECNNDSGDINNNNNNSNDISKRRNSKIIDLSLYNFPNPSFEKIDFVGDNNDLCDNQIDRSNSTFYHRRRSDDNCCVFIDSSNLIADDNETDGNDVNKINYRTSFITTEQQNEIVDDDTILVKTTEENDQLDSKLSSSLLVSSIDIKKIDNDNRNNYRANNDGDNSTISIKTDDNRKENYRDNNIIDDNAATTIVIDHKSLNGRLSRTNVLLSEINSKKIVDNRSIIDSVVHYSETPINTLVDNRNVTYSKKIGDAVNNNNNNNNNSNDKDDEEMINNIVEDCNEHLERPKKSCKFFVDLNATSSIPDVTTTTTNNNNNNSNVNNDNDIDNNCNNVIGEKNIQSKKGQVFDMFFALNNTNSKIATDNDDDIHKSKSNIVNNSNIDNINKHIIEKRTTRHSDGIVINNVKLISKSFAMKDGSSKREVLMKNLKFVDSNKSNLNNSTNNRHGVNEHDVNDLDNRIDEYGRSDECSNLSIKNANNRQSVIDNNNNDDNNNHSNDRMTKSESSVADNDKDKRKSKRYVVDKRNYVKLSDMDTLLSNPNCPEDDNRLEIDRNSFITNTPISATSCSLSRNNWFKQTLLSNSATSRSLSRIFNIAYREADENLTGSATAIDEKERSRFTSVDDDDQFSMGYCLGQDLLRMLKDEINTDVTVEVAGRRIKAHKCILSSRCRYFAAMLSGGYVQSSGNVISVTGYTHHSVYFAICHIYSGAMNIPEEINLKELAKLANDWCLDGLKQVIGFTLKAKHCHYFHKPCDGGCCTGIPECTTIAKSYGLDDIYQRCLAWLAKHYVRLWPLKSFASLPLDIIDKCYELRKETMTLDNVLEILSDCQQLLLNISETHWSRPSIFATRKLREAAIEFIARHFCHFIINKSYFTVELYIAKLFDIISLACDRMTPDELCEAYLYLQRTLRDAASNQQLLSKVKDQLEVNIINRSVDVCKSSSWLKLDKDVRRKIQTSSGVISLPKEYGRSRQLMNSATLTVRKRSKSATPETKDRIQSIKTSSVKDKLLLTSLNERKSIWMGENLQVLKATKEVLEKESGNIKRSQKLLDVKPRYLQPRQTRTEISSTTDNKNLAAVGSVNDGLKSRRRSSSVNKSSKSLITNSGGGVSQIHAAVERPKNRSVITAKSNTYITTTTNQKSNVITKSSPSSTERPITNSSSSSSSTRVAASTRVKKTNTIVPSSLVLKSASPNESKAIAPSRDNKILTSAAPTTTSISTTTTTTTTTTNNNNNNKTAVDIQAIPPSRTIMNRAANLRRNKFCTNNNNNNNNNDRSREFGKRSSSSCTSSSTFSRASSTSRNARNVKRLASSGNDYENDNSKENLTNVVTVSSNTLTRSNTFSVEKPTVIKSSSSVKNRL